MADIAQPNLLNPQTSDCNRALRDELRKFHVFGKATVLSSTMGIDTYTNEFWTSRQRASNSLHEISYRACFKAEVPRFFIERLTKPGDSVYDPFMGRGTTLIEAALLKRTPLGCDVNPLSTILTRPRLHPPTFSDVATRLGEINFTTTDEVPEDLLVFYHPDTLSQICSLKSYLQQQEQSGTQDMVDAWIKMTAINRLTGHSRGFFSVYTMPPNQAVSVESQRKINTRRKQSPDRRDVPEIILRKTWNLLSRCNQEVREILAGSSNQSLLLTKDCRDTPEITDGSVQLVVTSPPFLNVVDYALDNWLRCWFCGFNANEIPITTLKSVDEWREAMRQVFVELERVLAPGGYTAFEVGEVKNGKVLLEEIALEAAASTDLQPVLIMINNQSFTKTANCWGIRNNTKGTNSNRIVLLQKRENR